MPSGVSRARYKGRNIDLPVCHGAILAKLRVNAGMTVTGLAAVSGVSKSTISKMERGKTKPRIDTVEKVAEALQVAAIEFYAPKKKIKEAL